MDVIFKENKENLSRNVLCAVNIVLVKTEKYQTGFVIEERGAHE